MDIGFFFLIGAAVCFIVFLLSIDPIPPTWRIQNPIIKFRDDDGNILVKEGDTIAWKEYGTLFQGTIDEIRKDEKALIDVYKGGKGRKVIQL